MVEAEEVTKGFEDFCLTLGGKVKEVFERFGERTVVCKLPRRRILSIYASRGYNGADIYLGTPNSEIEKISAKNVKFNIHNVKELNEHMGLYTSVKVTTNEIKIRYAPLEGEVIFEI